MAKQTNTRGVTSPIGQRKSVALWPANQHDTDFWCIQFGDLVSPLDIEGGKLLPRAKAERHKNRILTNLKLSEDALLALYLQIEHLLPAQIAEQSRSNHVT